MLFLRFIVEHNFNYLLLPAYLFKELFAVMFKAIIADECLLNRAILLGDKFPYRY